MTDLILYTTEDGRSQITLRAKGQTVWLSQREMAQLFDVSTDNVGLHLKNIFAQEELEGKAVTEESSVVQIEGSREVRFRSRPRRAPSISITTSAARRMKRRQPTTKTRLICKPWKTH